VGRKTPRVSRQHYRVDVWLVFCIACFLRCVADTRICQARWMADSLLPCGRCLFHLGIDSQRGRPFYPFAGCSHDSQHCSGGWRVYGCWIYGATAEQCRTLGQDDMVFALYSDRDIFRRCLLSAGFTLAYFSLQAFSSMTKSPNPCVERTGTSHSAHLQFKRQWWLVPAAHARR
jgi:hypothetical protein